MKTNKFFALLIGVAALASCKSEDKPNGGNVIDFEKEYTELYALGSSVGKWDSNDPEPMTLAGKDNFVIEVDLIKCNENKLIKFCLTAGKDWSETDYLVPATVEEGKPYCFLKEGENKLQLTAEKMGGVKDWFFGLEPGKSGKYRIEVNPRTLTCKATKLSSLDDKEEIVVEWEEGMVYMIGDATPSGWTIAAPVPMVKNGAVFTWEGVLAEGEIKFPTEFRWDGPTYMAEVAGTEITRAGLNAKVVLAPNGDPDSKFRVTEAGEYKLTLDTDALTLVVEAK